MSIRRTVGADPDLPQAGVRTKTWTGLCRKTKTLPVFNGTQRAKRYFDSLFVIPANIGVNNLYELLDSCVLPFPGIEQLRF